MKDMIRGMPIAPGVVVARAFCLEQLWDTGESYHLDPTALPAEITRIEAACTEAARELDATVARVIEQLGEEQAAIFRAHRLLLHDPALISKVKSAIRDHRVDAATALQGVLKEYSDLFAQIQDEYLRERLADVRDVFGHILKHLHPPEGAAPTDPNEPAILVASEILPSHLLMLHRRLAGILTETGGSTGHAAILARSLGIPAVSGLPDILREVHSGDLVALDGREGHVYVNPGFEVETAYRRLEQEYADWRDRLAENREQESISADGIPVELLANINGPADVGMAARVGAGGVGLYRTEYLFLTHPGVPDEEEQLATYRAVIEAAPHRTVTIRTFDVGADKQVPYLGCQDEPNPSLGWRSTRLLSAHPEFFQTQLRAVLRAGCFGKVSLLFPMISLLEEVQSIKRMLDAARQALQRRGESFDAGMPVGIMLEVPAAAACLEDLLDEVDFVSIGTNDLIQYLMAADRNNPKVAYLCQPFSPAILRVLNQIIGCCTRRNKPVTLCGEMAGLPRCLLPLFGMGLRRFSMSPSLVPSIKELLRRTNLPMARAVAERVLRERTVGAVHDYLTHQAEQLWPEVARVGAWERGKVRHETFLAATV